MKIIKFIALILILTSIAKADGDATKVRIFKSSFLKEFGGIEAFENAERTRNSEKLKPAYKASLASKFIRYDSSVAEFKLDDISCRMITVFRDDHAYFTVSTLTDDPQILSQGKIPLTRKYSSIDQWEKDPVVVLFKVGSYLKK